MPLAWEDVSAQLDPSVFTIAGVRRRIAGADPWAEIGKLAQALPR
jgi:DNA primase